MLTKDSYEVKVMAASRFLTIKNTSDVALNGIAPGASVKIEADRDGVPLSRYWRNRVRDAATDGCVSFVEVTPPAKPVAKMSKEVK